MQRKLRQAVLAAEDASRAKSAFLANMSHEIRTPMNGVIGFSELALGGDVSVEEKNEYLRKIKSSGEALLRIINDVLDISKIEVGKLSLESIPFDIHEVLKLCRMLILPKAEEKGIELHYYAEHSEGKRLIGDPTRLQQALLNLLSNAVKFTDSGMVTLRSDILKDTGDSLTVSFEVKDSGIGMSEEQIKRIFDPFMQADDSTTRRYGGTGLGLSITKNIVELMGGKLKVESAPGAGSKFCFELKFETADQPNAAQEGENDRDGAERPIFEGDILVCEDNEINRQVICGHLARVGITVVTAANGREAVDIVRKRTESGEKPFDIILMDIHMPIMDGVEAAELIVVSGCKTPIVAMTADVMAEKKKYYRLHNMPDHIAKPFTAKDLWTCLLKYLTPASTETYGADKPETMTHVLAVDKEKAVGLFDRLAMLLESDSVESLELTDELRTLPGTGTLIRQIENYDYEPALQTLAAVRRSLGVDA